MSEHAPKTLALEAYLDEQLSPAGRARMERHLARCETCRSERALMESYRSTTESARELVAPEIDWSRIERTLEQSLQAPPTEEPRSSGSTKRSRWIWPAVAVAAAALLTWLAPGSPAPAPQQEREHAERTAIPVEPERPMLEGTITFAANEVTIEDAGGKREASLDERLTEGCMVRTGPDGIVHVRLAMGTGVALAPNSELRFEQLQQGRVRLALRQGHVVNEVAPLGDSDHYIVATRQHEAHVRGTHFAVSQRGELESVAVYEGRVEVRKGDELVRVLSAQERWDSADHGRTGADRPAVGNTLARVRGLDANADEWPVLQTPPLPDIEYWQPFDEPIGGGGVLRMRLPPGPGTLTFGHRSRGEQTLEFTLPAEGLQLEERQVLAAIPRPEVRWGSLEVEKIHPVVSAGMRGLQRCYERALRNEAASGSITLQLTISSAGAVTQTEVDAPDVPPALRRCMKASAMNWKFPAPEGGPVRLELPVRLKPRER